MHRTKVHHPASDSVVRAPVLAYGTLDHHGDGHHCSLTAELATPGTNSPIDGQVSQNGKHWRALFSEVPTGIYLLLLKCGKTVLRVQYPLGVIGNVKAAANPKQARSARAGGAEPASSGGGEPTIAVPGSSAASHSYLVASGSVTAPSYLIGATLVYPDTMSFDMDILDASAWAAELVNVPPYASGNVSVRLEVVDSAYRSASKTFTLTD